MKKNRVLKIIFGAALLAFSLLLTIGASTVFKACGMHGDGGWGACHWAQRAVTGVGAALTALSLLRLCARNHGVRVGLDAACVLDAALAVCIPGRLIDLCMMATMHCNAVMKPAVTALGAVIALIAAADLVIAVKSDKEGAAQ